ncbi:hypothetical protein HDU67_003760 [Dinochytrium kinnereticum]|nr:hypothetical protein HDU67_003760 [Dinochytrium kinnereticum]
MRTSIFALLPLLLASTVHGQQQGEVTQANIDQAKTLIQQAANILKNIEDAPPVAASLMAIADSMIQQAPTLEQPSSAPLDSFEVFEAQQDAIILNAVPQQQAIDLNQQPIAIESAPIGAVEAVPAVATPQQGACQANVLQVVVKGKRSFYGVDGIPVAINPLVPVQRICTPIVDDACRQRCSEACAEIRAAKVKGGKNVNTAALGTVVDRFNARMGITTTFAVTPLLLAM